MHGAIVKHWFVQLPALNFTWARRPRESARILVSSSEIRSSKIVRRFSSVMKFVPLTVRHNYPCSPSYTHRYIHRCSRLWGRDRHRCIHAYIQRYSPPLRLTGCATTLESELRVQRFALQACLGPPFSCALLVKESPRVLRQKHAGSRNGRIYHRETGAHPTTRSEF